MKAFNSEDDGFINVGLHYLGAVLKKKHEVRYTSFSQYTGHGDFLDLLRTFEPGAVCISFCSEAYNFALACASLAKRAGCHTIGGGVHFNLAAGEREQNPGETGDFDVIFRGESEWALEQYIDSGERRCGETIEAGPIANLDDLPFLDIDEWVANYLKHPGKKELRFPLELQGMPILASRGCQAGCLFCGNYRRPYRRRSPGNIAAEVKLRAKNYNIKSMVFSDDTVTADKGFILELAQIMQRENIKIDFKCGTRTDCLDEEIVQALKDAGCVRVNLGLESMNDKFLKFLGKGTTAEINYNAARLLRKHGIPMQANFIVGIPGETSRQYLEIEDFLRDFRPAAFHLYVFRPHLHTRLYKKIVRENRLPDFHAYENAYRNGEISEYAVQDGMSVKIFKDMDYEKIWKWRRDMFEKYLPEG
jgi:radical SAM superfamily enzyme YgiQ (UPF0313 family)